MITYPLSTLDARIERNWLLLLALSGVIALVVLLVSVLLARSFTKPLAELDEAAARLGEGDLRVRVPVPDDPPELSGLARSFNATAVRLEALLRSQQAFVADASHQLRTPLAALRLRLENLEAEGAHGEADDLERALTEVRRLSQLVDSLLLLARAEQSVPATVDLDLAAVVEGRVDAWYALAAERDIAIEANIAPVAVLGTPGRLEQVLDNLLNNAFEVAPGGTAVRVEARRRGDLVEIDVCDAGPGMSEDQRARRVRPLLARVPGPARPRRLRARARDRAPARDGGRRDGRARRRPRRRPGRPAHVARGRPAAGAACERRGGAGRGTRRRGSHHDEVGATK